MKILYQNHIAVKGKSVLDLYNKTKQEHHCKMEYSPIITLSQLLEAKIVMENKI